ncbi:MAG: hypothetical protein WAP52_00260 [Candidatus Sungiibacteriota bacterium]
MAKFVELILGVLQFQAEGLLEIGDILFALPVRIQKGFYRIPTHERQWFSASWAELYRDRQQFYKRLHYLKRQGLVVKRDAKGEKRWILTQRGAKRLREYRQLRADPFSSVNTNFSAPKGGGITIVAFDIPETERRKRGWLRISLVEMGFEPLQKSVWMAAGGVSEDFLHALRERRLLDAVHIFAVTQHGTIKKNI